MNDIEFINGLIVKAPNPKAPDFVKASISIQPAKLMEWLQTHAGEEWVNVDVKESRGGKWYAAVNAWKADGDKRDSQPAAPRRAPVPNCPQPDQGGATDGFDSDSIPF